MSTVFEQKRYEELDDDALVSLGLDAIFARYAPYVASIGYKLLGRHDEIDDLIQDVFLDAHRGLGKLQDPQALRGWLAKITVNQVRRRLRKRRVKLFFGMEVATIALEQEPDQGASAEHKVMVKRVFEIMDKHLSTEDQLAWTLQRIEGENLEHIADLMNCSARTVKRRVSRAQDVIRRELEKR